MIVSAISDLGPWAWLLFALVLLGAEILMPGIFLIWIGLAALAVGALSLLFWEASFWPWQVQWLAFAVLSVAAALGGRFVMARRGADSDQPLLNRRGESLVGRTGTLSAPLTDGRGRLKLDDTWWVVSGPDLPAGTHVRIVASNGRELVVAPN
jgi:inner membrane protein